MWPATTWDDQDWAGNYARGWTVLGRVRDKQRELLNAKREAQRRIDESAGHMFMLTPALVEQQYKDRLTAQWRGNFTVLAFLFAPPDEATIKMMNARGDYFDIRTGSTWDLFFPGYFRSQELRFESQVGSRSVGDQFARDWHFSPGDFDMLRRHVESATSDRWVYSGEADLVLINAYIPDGGEPTIDWDSVQAGAIRPPETLARVIERITRDLEIDEEDPSYGVGSVTRDSDGDNGGAMDRGARDLMVQALAGIATDLGLRALGLK